MLNRRFAGPCNPIPLEHVLCQRYRHSVSNSFSHSAPLADHTEGADHRRGLSGRVRQSFWRPAAQGGVIEAS
eukprot:1103477-Pelagomonas_calceolata.AAC.3